jgi:hypothetical protein
LRHQALIDMSRRKIYRGAGEVSFANRNFVFVTVLGGICSTGPTSEVEKKLSDSMPGPQRTGSPVPATERLHASGDVLVQRGQRSFCILRLPLSSQPLCLGNLLWRQILLNPISHFRHHGVASVHRY